MRNFICIALIFACLPLAAQVDRKEVRSGNRKFRKGEFAAAELQYRKAVLKDSTAFAAQYDLASALYRQEDYDGAQKALQSLDKAAPASLHATRYYYNLGDVALQKKDYGAAVKAFREALLRDPSDMDAKENYIYAKLMLKNGGGGGGGDRQQDQDQQQDRNQDEQQDQDNQNQDQPRQQDNQQQDRQPQPQDISPQQAQQILQAVQAKEKETQDKVNKEKAAAVKSRQKDKNW
ncbi:MAG: tetratricopeptide repeat protein [Bacteroidales bacterium]|nr:tetratricopeptide repeat protein [Bacteroidales bacterium]